MNRIKSIVLIVACLVIAATGMVGSLDYPAVRTATIVVAAYNSTEASKAQADYVCDGADDDSEIRAALAALPSAGGLVKLMEGTYSITETIILQHEDAIEGVGPRATRLNVAANNTNIFETANYGTGPKTRIRLANMELNGVKETYTGGNGTYGNFMYADIESVRFINWARNGMVINAQTSTGSLENNITKCTFRENDGNGLYMIGRVGDNHIIACSFYDNGGTTGSRSGSNLYFESVDTTYICQHIYVTNCFIEYGEYGINSEDAKNLNIMGCDISNNDKHGIYIHKDNDSYSSFFQINNNDFYNNGRAASNTYDGVCIDGKDATYKAGRAIISDNVFSGNNRTKHNVNLGSSSQLSEVTDNHFVGAVTAAVFDGGYLNMVRNNIGYKTEAQGYSTGTGQEQAIAHGLAETPGYDDVVIWDIDRIGIMQSGVYMSSIPDSQYIYVTATTGKKWGWKAEVR